MVNVPTIRILSHPTKYARHLHVLEPLLPEKMELKYPEILKTAREWAQNKRIVSGVLRGRRGPACRE